MSFVDWAFAALMTVGIAGLFLTRFKRSWPILTFIVGTAALMVEDLLDERYTWAALWAVFLGVHAWNLHRFLVGRREADSQ